MRTMYLEVLQGKEAQRVVSHSVQDYRYRHPGWPAAASAHRRRNGAAEISLLFSSHYSVCIQNLTHLSPSDRPSLRDDTARNPSLQPFPHLGTHLPSQTLGDSDPSPLCLGQDPQYARVVVLEVPAGRRDGSALVVQNIASRQVSRRGSAGTGDSRFG
jgi:hypothetical protein